MTTLRIATVTLGLGLVSTALAAQSAPAAEARPVVAVFPMTGFAPSVNARDLAAAFRDQVITELGTSTRIRLVERAALDELLTAQQVSLSGSVSEDVAVRVGRLIGADYAVLGSISFDARNARLDLRMVDIETSATVSQPFKETVSQDNLLSLVARVATDFAGTAKVKARVADVRVPAPAALAYSRGLDYERRGRQQDAARMFEKTLELFPAHPHARAALERVKQGGT